MRRLALATALVIVAAPVTALAQDADFSGNWTTTFGAMHIDQDSNGVRGHYATNDGRLRASVEGRALTGYWTESTGKYCSELRMGTHYWGRIAFRVSRDGSQFSGHWGYCDAEPTSDWEGHR
jgi:hypothetical protein